jgi:hypothetical protein
VTLPAVAVGQSVVARRPNLTGVWTAPKGVVQFNFIHRFSISDPPLRKVFNTPTFSVGTGLAERVMVGFVYGSNSTLVPRYPNEWELYAKARPLTQGEGSPLNLSVQGGYNVASESAGGELVLAREVGRARLLAAGRASPRPTVEDAEPGDVIAWIKPAVIDSPNTGHVAFIALAPIRVEP